MTPRSALLSPILLLLAAASTTRQGAQGQSAIRGVVRDQSGRAVGGLLVSARSLTRPVRVSVLTEADGRFAIPTSSPGPHRVEVHGPAWSVAPKDSVAPGDSVTLTAQPLPSNQRRHTSAAWLGLLPAGEAKRKFILDCTGCHQFNETRALRDGAPRSSARWVEDVARMLGFAGASSNFPVIAADRDPEATAIFVTAGLGGDPLARLDAARPQSAPAGRGTITEYDLPVSQDLPHDLAVDSAGRIVITGMFSHRMFVLDPATAQIREIAIPVPNANPRAIELDEKGDWWVLLGGPMRVARYEVQPARWATFPIGMYPHSIAVTPDGRTAWFNGHFTREPILLGRLDPATGAVDSFAAPSHPTLSRAGGPVPYEQRIAPDGRVWMSELLGNRLVVLDPKTRRFETVDLPAPHSGPRRFDVDRQGILWIPAYSGGVLLRFDPAQRRFTEYPLPIADALPYIARVDPRTGAIWIGTAAADAILRFEPDRQRFNVFPVPTRGATMRHLAIDPRSGDVWVAYGASPALHPSRIARLVVR